MKTNSAKKNEWSYSFGLLLLIADVLWWALLIMGFLGEKSILTLFIVIAFAINSFIIGRLVFEESHKQLLFLFIMILLQVIPYMLALPITENLL